MSSRILLVEDAPDVQLIVMDLLRGKGHEVAVSGDGEEALRVATQQRFDLIILDVMLPRLNGFEVLRQLRSEGIRIPTIVLSARDAELDIVMGLEFGAEDYVTKPFGLAELLARIKAVFRRPAPERVVRSGEEPAPQKPAAGALGVIQLGELSIDSRARQVKRVGEEIPLTATEFDILWCLVQADGRVLAREEIQALVWGPRHHGTLRTIDNFMMQLRTKLERDPTAPEHLLTVRGVGYRLAQ